ncbi:hypothetical protein SAMN05518846_11797 [Brevibacillus centrosporus]|uniref:Uncharacterized protein n=1 Tax=Brevibacillus centrosporus TaxID=54910 RepID=A0A1I4BGF5_9BACL|nr:hypothetical protein SAMN05518846_11797 [Brevibacillus centrosporus]
MTIKMIVRVAIVWAILTVTGCSASSEKTNDLYQRPTWSTGGSLTNIITSISRDKESPFRMTV